MQEGGIPLNIRQWECAGCQTVHIRDENAGINGLRKVLRDLLKKNGGEYPSIVSGSDRAFVEKRWAWSVLPSGITCNAAGVWLRCKSQLQEIKPRAW